MGANESSEIIKNYETNEERRAVMKSNFIPEAYSGFLLCELSREYQLILISDYEDEEELIKCGIKLYRSIDEAIRALDLTNSEKVYILPNSCTVLPKIR